MDLKRNTNQVGDCDNEDYGGGAFVVFFLTKKIQRGKKVGDSDGGLEGS